MFQKTKVYIMGAKKVDFTNRETGEIVKGTTVYYFTVDNNNSADKTDSTEPIGQVPSKYFLRDGKDQEVLKNGTGIYNLLIEINLLGNRPRLEIKGFEFLKKADLIVKE